MQESVLEQAEEGKEVKIVINRSHGFFVLSTRAEVLCLEAGLSLKTLSKEQIRKNPIVISVIERLGTKASGEYSDLRVVEIPDDVDWEIHEEGGKETVREKHRQWPARYETTFEDMARCVRVLGENQA